MRKRFEELDWQQTPMGELSLRRRTMPSSEVDVYEVKLGDEFLMSSLFTVAEVELARLGLAEAKGAHLDVLVGGLGLGYTADAVLDDSRVRSLTVVDALPQVLDWHRRHLLPDTVRLTEDPRTRLLQRDFFASVRRDGFGQDGPTRFHAILLDIDHTPGHVLDPSHSPFYTVEGLTRMHRFLHPEGVFALWSDDPPDEEFGTILERSFSVSSAHVVAFDNPLTGGRSANTVYLARL